MFVDTQVRPQGEQVDAVAPAKMKLSEIVRECGYGLAMDYEDCVLGRAYKKMIGRSLFKDAANPQGLLDRWTRLAAETLGVPYEIAVEAEKMCLFDRPAESIASWLESQGL